MLVVGEDEEIRSWVRNHIVKNKLPWRVRFTCPLRLLCPENQLGEQDAVVIIWDRTMPVPIEEILTRTSISRRSVESAVCAIEQAVGDQMLRRTIVLASSITREDTVFLGEYGVKLVYTLPAKRSQWDTEAPEFFRRLQKLHDDESAAVNDPEEVTVKRFLEMLSAWERLSDEAKMAASEDLLRVLGDTSRYAEMIARKCLKEGDRKGAEQWLRRAISKNPNYLRAMRLLADVYMAQGNHAEALALLERLKANNPRNFQRLTKIGRCYLALGEHQKAEKVLCDALSIDEFYQEAREELGKVKCVLGDYENARVLLANSPHRKHLAAFLNGMGIRLVEQRKFAESIEHYKKAQFVLPGNDQNHLLFFNIGLAYAKWGKLHEAVRYARLALIREPCYEKAESLLKSIEQRQTA